MDSEIWKSYIEYLDDMVVEGFLKTINCSLQFLLTNTDVKQLQFPLFESRLELQVPDMVFVPALDFNINGGFFNIMEEILFDIYHQASLINRLASHYDQTHYQVY